MFTGRRSFVFALAFFALSAPLFGQNPTDWGERAATPAVVHPAVSHPSREIISLRGDWDFVTFTPPEPIPADAPDFDSLGRARKIEIPGCWEAQGVGKPGMSETWDCKWDCNPRPLRHIYRGAACFRRSVPIPNDWKNREIWLKIGGVRTEAWFWVNGRAVGRINNFCGTYKFNVTGMVKPGETAEILAIVRNDTPSRKGQMCDFHKFGGFYRDIELEATPRVWLDDVWVQGEIGKNADKRVARVHLTLRTNGDKTTSAATVKIRTPDGPTLAERTLDVVAESGREEETVVEIPVPNARLWSPESPVLYWAEVEIANQDGTRHGWTERFGFRRLEVVGKRFFLNGKPCFLRGYGETFIYPETLVSPADRSVHLANMTKVKASGFTYARMHTHCEIPEFFEAADEAGILIQPELPYYQANTTEAFPFDPLGDLRELYRHYRRYVSLATYSMGNEGHLGSPIDRELLEWVHRNDPDRPCEHQDGGNCTPENSDFGSPTSSIKPWPLGRHDDYPLPFIAHEYLNLTVKLDPRLEEKFTGAIPSPVSMADYEKRLAEFGLTRTWGDACIQSAHALQAYHQKAGIEAARSDPACDGYSFWNFIDQMVIQGAAYTSQGYLNAFYEVKDGGTPLAEFAEFNAPTVLFARLPEPPIFVAGEKSSVEFLISHYGDDELPAGEIEWSLGNDKGTARTGKTSFEKMSVGDVKTLGRVETAIPEVTAPTEMTLTAKVVGSEIVEHKPVWIFPKRDANKTPVFAVSQTLWPQFKERYPNALPVGDGKLKPTDPLVTTPDEEAFFDGIRTGRSILTIRPATGGANTELGWWSFGPQLGTAFARHDAFGDFPHNGLLTPLWFRLVKTDPLDLRETETPWEPLALGETVDSYALYLGQAAIGENRVLASFGLDLTQGTPESLALLDALLRYIASDRFAPTVKGDLSAFFGSAPEGIHPGFRRILTESPESGFGPTYREPSARAFTCRQKTRENRIDWETDTLLETESADGDSVRFLFAGALGYASQPKTDGFEFLVNDRPLLRFDLPEKPDAERAVWRSSDGRSTLDFRVLAHFSDGQDFSGVFLLTVPRRAVTFGQPQKFSVRSLGEGSVRWFDLIPYRRFTETEAGGQ